MKVVKIIHKASRPNDEGYWLVWAMVYINGSSRFCTLIYDTFEESRAVSQNDLLDIEKQRFSLKPFK